MDKNEEKRQEGKERVVILKFIEPGGLGKNREQVRSRTGERKG